MLGLSLDDNNITDVTPLATFKVVSLSLANNNIADISALNASTIVVLNVSGNPIADFAHLSAFSLLRELDVSSTGMTAVGALKGLELTELVANDNQIVSLAPLVGMSLSFFDLSQNQITDIPQDFSFPATYCRNSSLKENTLSESTLRLLSATCDDDASIEWDEGFCEICFVVP